MVMRTITRIAAAVVLEAVVSSSFLAPTVPIIRQQAHSVMKPEPTVSIPAHFPYPFSSSSTTSTALNVWWFGGTDTAESSVTGDDDSCELVAVRIEKPSSNSRKIFGEIVAPVPLEDAWFVLTDYDRLSVHVPYLVESKIVNRPSTGEQGDGTYRCRLFQKGAQKIIGFEFGASVTMDMQERINDPSGSERSIEFKCYDSFFFNAFDGYWKATERMGSYGQLETLLSYVVDVRPKGPVPVAALEWRIREDVPTNLRAVKKAAVEVGRAGVLASRGRTTNSMNAVAQSSDANGISAVSEKQTAASPSVRGANGKRQNVD